MKKNTINNQQNTGTKPYVPPLILVEDIEPWTLLAGSYGEIDGSGMPGGGNDDEDDPEAKSMYFFYSPYKDMFFEDY